MYLIDNAKSPTTSTREAKICDIRQTRCLAQIDALSPMPRLRSAWYIGATIQGKPGIKPAAQF